MPKFDAPKGTHDIIPTGKHTATSGETGENKTSWVYDIRKWHWIEGVARNLCQRFGYEEIRTPMFESTDLFKRAVGDGTDIVTKEMYDFETKGGDRLTLRPEGTAPALRAFVQHRMDLDRPVHKLFYIAPIFRHEAPQLGRYRQHHQFGVEVLGAKGPDVDVEVISLAMSLFRALGIQRLTLKVNSVGTVESRAQYVEALREYAAPFVSKMSEDNQRRFRQNALRMLDSKDARDQELLAGAPLLADHLDPESREHFERLRGLLTDLGIEHEVDPRLVRGFDYYTQTAFEVQSPHLGAQSTLAGGGRYDRLVEDLGGIAMPGIGFGLGIERLLIALKAAGVPTPEPVGIEAFLCPLGDAARRACIKLLAELREAGLAADMDYSGRKMKAMLEQAEYQNARFAVVIGDDELAAGTAVLRTMPGRQEREEAIAEGRKPPPAETRNIPQADLVSYLRGAS